MDRPETALPEQVEGGRGIFGVPGWDLEAARRITFSLPLDPFQEMLKDKVWFVLF